jgi:RNA polymerase sigma factor (sigma-70 family)
VDQELSRALPKRATRSGAGREAAARSFGRAVSRFFRSRYEMNVRPVAEIPDAELLRAAGRDADRFAAFYRRYEQPVLAFMASRTGRPELAADLCAETFAAALAASGRYRPEGESAAAWLFGIARRVLASSVRRGRVEQRARRRLGMLEPLVLDDTDLERVEQIASAPERVLEMLQELPRAQRDAVRERVLEERGYGELALGLLGTRSESRYPVTG